MSKRGSLLLLGLTSSLMTQTVQANEGLSTTIHHHYQSTRPLGMGDAFVAVANDYNAIFYNPAGLARRDDGQINLSLSVAGSVKSADFYNDVKKVQDSNVSDSEKSSQLFDLIQDNYGTTHSLRLNPTEGIWVRPNWGIAVIPADVSLEMTMHQQVGPAINATAYVDSTVGLAYADDFHGFDHGRFSWGVTGKFVNRGWASKALSAVELAADSQIIRNQDLREGYTVDADIGFLWTPELPDEGMWSLLRLTRPTFGAVVRNVAETGFGQSMKLLNKESTEAPEKLYRVIDVGTRWEYPELWIFGGRGVMDIRDINHPNFNLRKGLHLGFEFDWTVASWWKGQYRVGLSQSFWTAGFSAELGIFNLDFASYANDVGTYSTAKESRIYEVKLNLDF